MSQNQEQIEFWNGPRAKQWVAGQELMDRQLAPFSAATLDAARLAPGERVVDIGCGCGGTTLAIAESVGPSGHVLGVDISHPMLTRARERACDLPQVRIEHADAATFAFDGSADVLFSRFGIMFFDDPRSAFANLRRALKSTGRLAFVCWRQLVENEWMSFPLAAAVSVLQPPRQPTPPDAPGPYAFADPQRVQAVLEGAGFQQVALTPFDCVMAMGHGGGLDAATEEVLTIGPAARLVLDATPEQQARTRVAVRDALAPFVQEHEVRLRAAAWIVTARV